MRQRAVNPSVRRLGASATVALVGAAPFVVFRGTVEGMAREFRFEFVYLVGGWAPFLLMTLGSLCFVPVVLSMYRDGYSRLYLRPVTRHAWQAWGLVLYLLGGLLAVQTAQIHAVW